MPTPQILIPDEGAIIEGKITWRNSDGSKHENDFVLELENQNTNIDWDSLKTKKPYSLEPVETLDDLIGRKNVINKLLADINADNVGSSYIHGQRRVGKTSIVKVLRNLFKEDNTASVIYLTGGKWSTEKIEQSINNLGRKICRELQKNNSKFKNISIPNFDGDFTQITDFLDDLEDIDNEHKVLIVLDEYDKINPNLFGRSNTANSFNLSLRSIMEDYKNCGFVLVGAENLPNILAQSEEFNKLDALQVDYFNTNNKEWEDYQDLVRKPVEKFGIEIQDDVINFLYENTYGNPYFTKLICSSFYNEAVENRDSHVTIKEIRYATKIAIEQLGATSFSHFWEDGIMSKNKELTISARKNILIAIAESLKKQDSVSKNTILDYVNNRDIENKLTNKILEDFVRRNILIKDEDSYKIRMEFLKRWLMNSTEKIRDTFSEEEKIEDLKKLEEENRVKTHEIEQLVQKWENHLFRGQKITIELIRNWLEQFEEVNKQRRIFNLLENLLFYSDEKLNLKMDEFYDKIRKTLKKNGKSRTIQKKQRKRNDILISYLEHDDITKSGAECAKLFADRQAKDIYTGNNCVPNEIVSQIKSNQNINILVFLDDFTGTGNQICENLEFVKHELDKIPKEREVIIFIGVICGFEDAKEKIEAKIRKLQLNAIIEILDILTNKDKCFHKDSEYFKSANDRRETKDTCFEFGLKLQKDHPLGYNDSQALVVFPRTCPNNTLPIFWKKTETWNPLFERIT